MPKIRIIILLSTIARFTVFCIIFHNDIENTKILSMLLAHKPDITIKNKKGQTAIDITNSKTIISMFWQYLSGNLTNPEDEIKLKKLNIGKV